MRTSDKARYREKRRLEQNDKCFFCHLRMRDDCTAEHLHAKADGGKDTYSNLRATHGKCNVLVGRLPVEEKLRLHWIGKLEGSDEFFREVNKLRGTKKSKPKRKKIITPQFKIVLESEERFQARIRAQERRISLRNNLPVMPSAACK